MKYEKMFIYGVSDNNAFMPDSNHYRFCGEGKLFDTFKRQYKRCYNPGCR